MAGTLGRLISKKSSRLTYSPQSCASAEPETNTATTALNTPTKRIAPPLFVQVPFSATKRLRTSSLASSEAVTSVNFQPRICELSSKDRQLATLSSEQAKGVGFFD